MCRLIWALVLLPAAVGVGSFARHKVCAREIWRHGASRCGALLAISAVLLFCALYCAQRGLGSRHVPRVEASSLTSREPFFHSMGDACGRVLALRGARRSVASALHTATADVQEPDMRAVNPDSRALFFGQVDRGGVRWRAVLSKDPRRFPEHRAGASSMALPSTPI